MSLMSHVSWCGGWDEPKFPDEAEEGIVKELREVVRKELEHVVDVGRCTVVPACAFQITSTVDA